MNEPTLYILEKMVN